MIKAILFWLVFLTLLSPVSAKAGSVLLFDDFDTLNGAIWQNNWLGASGAVTKPVNITELNCYDPAQVTAFGELRLMAERRSCGEWNYASGLINSAHGFQFLYGMVEARAWMPEGAGLWSSIWLNGGGYELNIIEAYGTDRSTFHVHDADCTGACDGGATPVAGATAGWHTYAINWTPLGVGWLYDGELVYYENTRVPNQPMYIVVNLGINADPAAVPAMMQVDWIRVTGNG